MKPKQMSNRLKNILRRRNLFDVRCIVRAGMSLVHQRHFGPKALSELIDWIVINANRNQKTKWKNDALAWVADAMARKHTLMYFDYFYQPHVNVIGEKIISGGVLD